ncbi:MULTISPECIES: PDZ domain-containing protein [unclassified Arenibacter]|uniref:PDZ domain-containing protein n=1 Tax=unclassified Arenibacter TaxID=2615047 RepID=UPI000E34FDC1|nr:MULTISPECIES: PDZ domain-containing protein [unclassified Arenibacter]MCM4162292.1 peptide-binding protein [Arenibacter sp. A80]RFT57894.1 PDZ domain-containing protein [Arenibacter sp. P308M17]
MLTYLISNYRIKWPSIILLIVLFINCKSNENTIDLYVGKGHEDVAGPIFDNIDEALEEAKDIRSKDKMNPITIHVSQGEYYLDSTLLLTPLLNNLQIIGQGADKVTFKGSKKLELDWKRHSDHIWVSKIPDNTNFDQLFVDGKKQVLARYPNYDENGGHWQGHASDAIDPERIKGWSQPIGAILHAMHAGEWGGFHFVISGIDENGQAILEGGHQNNRTSAGIHEKYRMVENVFEELDSPGEWYMDKNSDMLYYWPQEGVDLNKDLVEGSHLKHLVDIKGDDNVPVKDVLIEGIRFEHAKRTIMEPYEQLLRSDWTIYRGGALFMEGTENITIKDCEFRNLGGNAIFLSEFNKGALITGNHIHDCGASAISFVGSPSAVRSPSFQYREFVDRAKLDTIKGPLNNSYPRECIADNNLIYRIGRLEKQTAGVEISMAMDITVSNNSIYEVPRAGINVSEGTWGGHIIEYNDVFSTVLESGDHGSFNSWGRDRFWHPDRTIMDKMTLENPNMPLWDAIHTTIIRNNRFRCDHGWDIDLDDGSTNYKIYNNLCLNGGIKLREGFFRTVENNIMINNGFHPHVWFKNSGDVFRKNIVMTDHKDIRLQAWGKEVDYNFFTDQESLLKSQENGIDTHSIYGYPKFLDPENGDFRVEQNSPAMAIGFTNFPMDSFGVKKPALKALAKTPEIPDLLLTSDAEGSKAVTMDWLGGNLKNIETLAERSASGLNKTAGILILAIEPNSIMALSELQVGDVIIGGEEREINEILDLRQIIQAHNWKGSLNLTVFRNQKSIDLRVPIKK